MTYKGGWVREEPFYIEDQYERPESDDDYIITLPGRYREIRRVDGRIDEVLWNYETEDAQSYYEQQREQEEDVPVEEFSTEESLAEPLTTERDIESDLSEEDRRQVERLQTILNELEKRLDDRNTR